MLWTDISVKLMLITSDNDVAQGTHVVTQMPFIKTPKAGS